MEKTKTKNYKNRESRKKIQRPRDIFIKIIERKFKSKGDADKDTGNMQNIT